MAAGLPVVSSNAAPCERIVTETGAGIVFPSRDVAALAAALLKMSDPSRRRELGSAGQEAVGTKYNWEKAAQAFVRIVTEERRHRRD
jgi:glycosyltransferase involved in cell wall biosynthesis